VLTNSSSTELELQHAEWVENIDKIVFSRTMNEAGWNNTRLIKKNIGEQVSQLKRQPGRNMMIFGSPGLTHSFMQLNLIDEYKFNVNPVILGKGIPFFENISDRVDLQLVSEKKFKSGVIGLHYKMKHIL
jgi:dihydrofolate reductase